MTETKDVYLLREHFECDDPYYAPYCDVNCIFLKKDDVLKKVYNIMNSDSNEWYVRYIRERFHSRNKANYFDIIKYKLDTCTDVFVEDSCIFPSKNKYETIYDSRMHIISENLEIVDQKK